jgi:hypothetical protein
MRLAELQGWRSRGNLRNAFLQYRDDILNHVGILGILLSETNKECYGLAGTVQFRAFAVWVYDFCGFQPWRFPGTGGA